MTGYLAPWASGDAGGKGLCLDKCFGHRRLSVGPVGQRLRLLNGLSLQLDGPIALGRWRCTLDIAAHAAGLSPGHHSADHPSGQLDASQPSVSDLPRATPLEAAKKLDEAVGFRNWDVKGRREHTSSCSNLCLIRRAILNSQGSA